MRPEPDRGGGVAAGPMPGGGVRHPSLWRTPTPYLFLGVAAMMAVIVVALLVLLCTRRRNPSSRQLEDAADGGGDKAASVGGVLVPLDREPCRVVVIMAGDRAPSFLASAKPLALDTTGGGAAAAV
ncbi:unnamed protein product [Urochloa decumbens]|uniref:Uncharacterized protein n=1 Tax=Urochloa decumbens TaxID=240449 RepID=A0ABC9EA74_9POAL